MGTLATEQEILELMIAGTADNVRTADQALAVARQAAERLVAG